jgi:2'-5' RNA ligase
MRLFVALEIPAAVRDNLAAQIKELRDLSAQVADKRPRWVRPENLHVTLKFIGEVSPAKLEGIRGVLAAIHSVAPVDLQFRGLGFFPNEQHPRVLWAGIAATPNLPSLAADIDSALEKQGVAREERTFTPHLTLARLEPPGLHENLRAAIQQNSRREFGSFEACEFHLIESKLKPAGAEYTSLASFPFAALEA